MNDDREPPREGWRWTVDDTAAGTRLDQFLAAQDLASDAVLGITRSRLKKLIETGLVTVDGLPSRPAKKLREDQVVALTLPEAEPLDLVPEEIPLEIIYDDDFVVVVNKQQNLVVHPGPGHPSGSLVNGLLFRHALAGGDPLRPGIVHRLDKDTSGLMVVAKREDAHAALAVQFHDHTVDRRYRVIVTGTPPDEGQWETLHGRSPHNRRRFTSKVTRGKRAKSRFVTKERFAEGAAVLQVQLMTGRTHQVRVHCHDHGFPVLGDRLYPPKHLSPTLRQIHGNLPGQALHAELLGFVHPATGERLHFESPPPPSFCAALDALRALV
jgi:23S rRNA pseudouridine1911/1915/1917 synthase